MLTLNDYSRQPGASVQPEAKSLPNTLLLALDDNSIWSRAPVSDQGTHHFRKRFNFLHETLCLLWSNTCHQVCRSNLKTYVTQCVKIWKSMPILSSEVLPINRSHFPFSLFTTSFSLASFSLKSLFIFSIVFFIFHTSCISSLFTQHSYKNGRYEWIQPSHPENLFFQET